MHTIKGSIFRSGRFVPGTISYDRTVTAITSHPCEERCYIIPGLVDIHTHGAVGVDASSPGADLGRLACYYAAQGVTAWAATTLTTDEATLRAAMQSLKHYADRPHPMGAKLAGIHLEGPFLSRYRRGMQPEQHLKAPDIPTFHRLNELCEGRIRLVTLAPELDGALELIREVSKFCTVALGHTNADYDTAMAAFAQGAAHVTHLWNAMTPFHHRNPGVAAAAADAGATVELICDGIHNHPAAVRLTKRLFEDKLVLVSDSLPCAGLPDGAYSLQGQSVTLNEGCVTLTHSATLAGSAFTLMDCLRHSVDFGLPLEAAITAATQTPAAVLGMSDTLGVLEVGRQADLVVLDENLSILAVYIGGEQVV